MNNFKEMKARELISAIDNKYLECKRKGMSRYNPEWGLWSREMNTPLKDRINTHKEIEHGYLVLVFNYWNIRSNLLQCYYEGKLLNMFTINRYRKEAIMIKETIVKGKEPPLYTDSFDKIASKILGVNVSG